MSKILADSEAITFKILVPVYKTEKYLDECILSVLQQSYTNFELIIVDDGSPDNCGSICDKYAKEDSRIKVIHQENKGLLAARRTAISYILNNNYNESDFVVFLDSDDYLKKQALELIYEEIKKENCDMIIYGIDRVFNGKVVIPFVGEPDCIITDKAALYKKMLLNKTYNPLCRKAISAGLLSDEDYSEYYGISMGEDLMQSIPLYKGCRKVSIINKSLYNYTINPNSISEDVNYSNYENNHTVRKCVFDFLIKENVFSQEEFAQYRSYCIKLLVENLITIFRFNVETRKKEQLAEDIYNSDYYRNYIKKKPYDSKMLKITNRIIYYLFEKKIYRCINAFVAMHDAAVKIKRAGAVHG